MPPLWREREIEREREREREKREYTDISILSPLHAAPSEFVLLNQRIQILTM